MEKRGKLNKGNTYDDNQTRVHWFSVVLMIFSSVKTTVYCTVEWRQQKQTTARKA